MALSKETKARIRFNKKYRLEMWKYSQVYGTHYRIFTKVRLTIAFNQRAAQKDTFGELFFPVQVIVLPPWQPTARNIRRAARQARRNNMANGA